MERTDGAETSTPHIFERYGHADVAALIDEYPLAWIISAGSSEASLLPLLGEYGGSGELVSLLGHIPVRDPLYAALLRMPSALILFQGPQGYVSPAYAGRRNWAPTWNFAQLRIDTMVEFSPELTIPAVETLVERMEAAFPAPWKTDGLDERAAAMWPQIIGFRARVEHVRGRFKLGQDENPETLRHILNAMPRTDLSGWTRRFNEGRTE